ncbi:MAG: GtrA family protein [Phenylobacterium sp.]|nr:GtrA family protein [Phenylobacterium sp.]
MSRQNGNYGMRETPRLLDVEPRLTFPLMPSRLSALFAGRRRLVRFIASGGGTALLFFCLSYLGMRLGFGPFAASAGAYAVAFLVGYAIQRGWTFEGRHKHGRALPRYLLLQLGCALLTSGVSQAAASLFAVPPLAISLMATALAGAISFTVSLLWVFPDGDAEPSI